MQVKDNSSPVCQNCIVQSLDVKLLQKYDRHIMKSPLLLIRDDCDSRSQEESESSIFCSENDIMISRDENISWGEQDILDNSEHQRGEIEMM